MKKTFIILVTVVLVSLAFSVFASAEQVVSLTYEEVNKAVFDIKVDGERVFKHPDEEMMVLEKMPFRGKGAAVTLQPTFSSDGSISFKSANLWIFKNGSKVDVTIYDIEEKNMYSVIDLVVEPLNRYIDYENEGKLTFCFLQDIKESLVLFEYSPLITQFSDEDIFKTQNYIEYDDIDKFKNDVRAFIEQVLPNAKTDSSTDEKASSSDYVPLKKGSKGTEVIDLQNRLNELGYSIGKADGDYGGKTEKAVKRFQKDNGLEQTGIVDEATHKKLFPDVTSDSETVEERDSFSELTEFKSVMMESVSDQIDKATDFMSTANDRAILAALLSLEFANQQPDFKYDYSLPIYVCKQGDIASVAMGGEKDYVVIIFQNKPLSTSYGYFYDATPATAKAALEMTNEEVWTVDLDTYNEKLAALVQQIG